MSNDPPDPRRTNHAPDFVIDDELLEEDAPLTEAQRLEAKRRLLEYEAHPERYSTWEEVKRRLESKR